MDWRALWGWAVLPEYVAAAGMLGIALWLLYLNFNNRIHRAFALFLFFRGMTMLVATGAEEGVAADQFYLRDVQPYVQIPIVFALAFFITIYPHPRGWLARNPIPGYLLIAGALIVEGLYAWRHEWMWEPHLDAKGDVVAEPTHLLSILATGFYLLYGVLAWLLARDYQNEPPGPRRRAIFLVMVAFALNNLFDFALAAQPTLERAKAAFQGLTTDSDLPTAWASVAMAAAGGILLAATLARLAVISARAKDSEDRRNIMTFFGLGLVAFFTGILARQTYVTDDWELRILLVGSWRLFLPVLVAYALVRHRLFDLDVKIKWTLDRGTLATFYIATFFMVSQIAQNYFQTQYDWAVGGVAAGLLLFALHPLQNLSHRLADAVMPGVKPASQMEPSEREALYENAARIAWADGTLDTGERAILDRLAERLPLDAATTMRIERDAARDVARKRRAPRRQGDAAT